MLLAFAFGTFGFNTVLAECSEDTCTSEAFSALQLKHATSTRRISQNSSYTITPDLDLPEDCIKGHFPITNIDGSHSGSHTINIDLTMPDYEMAASAGDVRQWILNLGQAGAGAQHWLWTPTGQHGASRHGGIQFGAWNGAQIQTFDATHDEDFDPESTKEIIAEASSLTTVFDAGTGTYQLFMDHIKVAERNVGATAFSIKDPGIYVGVFPASPSGPEVDFSGCIKRVEVWAHALSESEVASLVYTQKATSCSDTGRSALKPGEANNKTYRCDNGDCVAKHAVCNGYKNCRDDSDEKYCNLGTSDADRFKYRKMARKNCPMKNGQVVEARLVARKLKKCATPRASDGAYLCIPASAWGNNFCNCEDGSDEVSCSGA